MRATVLLAALLCGCPTGQPKPENTAPPAPASKESPGSAPVVARLERTQCYGLCPVYKITIRSNETVEYDGTSFVKVKGHQEGKLRPGAMADLRRAFDQAHFSSLQNSYETHSQSDAPTAIVSYTNDKVTKTVRHYGGDLKAPPELRVLEKEIDRIVEIEQWIGTPEERMKNVGAWR